MRVAVPLRVARPAGVALLQTTHDRHRLHIFLARAFALLFALEASSKLWRRLARDCSLCIFLSFSCCLKALLIVSCSTVITCMHELDNVVDNVPIDVVYILDACDSFLVPESDSFQSANYATRYSFCIFVDKASQDQNSGSRVASTGQRVQGTRNNCDIELSIARTTKSSCSQIPPCSLIVNNPR